MIGFANICEEELKMKKLVWNNDKPEWVETTEQKENAEFRATHGGKSALELLAEKRKA